MNILILNWRDIKNPLSGGAEQLTHELAKRMASDGHKVIQYSPLFTGCKNTEIVDNVKIIRKGNWWNVRFYAFFDYVRFFNRQIDIIIDEVHFFPFFSYLYAPKKTILLVCEVAQPLFPILFKQPLAKIFQILERLYLYIYKNVPTVTISESTKQELFKYGFTNIKVIPMGVTLPDKLPNVRKEKKHTLLYLARLNKQKGAYDAIEICRIVKEKIPNIHLLIAGKGSADIMKDLNILVNKYKLNNNVSLLDFINEKRKFELLSKAYLLLNLSSWEGWGLVNIEANSVGTPVIAYDVPGSRDSVKNERSGLLFPKGATELIAEEIIKLWEDKERYDELSLTSMLWSKQFNWNRSYTEFYKAIFTSK
jgi:glycosyltransferase involved in cell wall biosynthesis